MEKAYGFVYVTTNLINGKKYVGKCIYERQNNWETYLGSGTYLKRAIKKYGKDNFSKEILEEANSSEELNLLEEKYILMFDAVNSDLFYNIKLTSIGGDVFTYNPRKEEIRDMRKKQMSGNNNHQYGKPKTKKMIDSVKKSNSKPVQIDGIIYGSLREASISLNIKETALSYRLSSDSFPSYIRLKESTNKRQMGCEQKQKLQKKVMVFGKEYSSIKEAAKDNNMKYTTLQKYLRDHNKLEYAFIDK